MVVNLIANVLSNTFFLVNKPFKLYTMYFHVKDVKNLFFFTSTNQEKNANVYLM